MEWKIFSMEWNCNGRKLPVWNMEKVSLIPYHALAISFTYLSNQDKISAKFEEVESHMRLQKCKKLRQRYRKFVDLWLQVANYPLFGEFAVVE